MGGSLMKIQAICLPTHEVWVAHNKLSIRIIYGTYLAGMSGVTRVPILISILQIKTFVIFYLSSYQ